MPSPNSPDSIGVAANGALVASISLNQRQDEDRLLLLCQLTQGERNVGELEGLTGIRQPTLSQQLGVLRDEGMVNTRRMGKYIFYSLASFEVVCVMQALSGLYCGQALKK